jgi:hypothetical protein
VVLPRCVFAYYVHDYEPADYSTLVETRDRTVAPDHLRDIPAPGSEAFAAHAKDRLSHLPLFVRGPELFTSPLSVVALRNQLNSALAAAIFLRRGATLPYPDKRHEDWRREMPQYLAPLAEVESLHRSQRTDAAHRAAFRLVRGILRDAWALMIP